MILCLAEQKYQHFAQKIWGFVVLEENGNMGL